jgi:hypothetical protein
LSSGVDDTAGPTRRPRRAGRIGNGYRAWSVVGSLPARVVAVVGVTVVAFAIGRSGRDEVTPTPARPPQPAQRKTPSPSPPRRTTTASAPRPRVAHHRRPRAAAPVRPSVGSSRRRKPVMRNQAARGRAAAPATTPPPRDVPRPAASMPSGPADPPHRTSCEFCLEYP